MTRMDEGGGEITRLVERWSAGDPDAFDRLIELVYDDLRQIAHRHLGLARSDETINTTALVHEAYLRMENYEQGLWRSRAHFFAFASKAMRHILIDYARGRRAAKRGGTRIQVPLNEDLAAGMEAGSRGTRGAQGGRGHGLHGRSVPGGRPQPQHGRCHHGARAVRRRCASPVRGCRGGSRGAVGHAGGDRQQPPSARPLRAGGGTAGAHRAGWRSDTRSRARHGSPRPSAS